MSESDCPTCGAVGDAPCVSLGGPGTPPGLWTKRPHKGRTQPKEPAACGTYAGLNRHKRERTEPCADCKAAGAAYIKAWRDADPDHRARQHRRRLARQRALSRLAVAHAAELDRLLAEELAMVGR